MRASTRHPNPGAWTALAVPILLVFFAAGCSSGGAEAQESAQGRAASQARDETVATAPRRAETATPHSIPVVAKGQAIDLADYVTAGQITVFDFYSEYCGPCRRVAPYLERLDAAREDVKVVKIDINRPGVRGIDWQSPVARQYRLQSIPHFKVYGTDGKLMAEGQAAAHVVFAWIEELES